MEARQLSPGGTVVERSFGDPTAVSGYAVSTHPTDPRRPLSAVPAGCEASSLPPTLLDLRRDWERCAELALSSAAGRA